MTSEEPYRGVERRAVPRRPSLERVRRPMFDLLRWIEGHVRGFYPAVALFLLSGLALMLLIVLGFGGLAVLVAQDATQRFDLAVLLWLNRFSSMRMDAVALEVTALGSLWVVWMTVLVASVFLWATRHRYSAVLLWVALLGGTVLNAAFQLLFDRPRPDLFEWRSPYAGHPAFPSGHAMTAVVVYAALAYLVVRLETSRGLRRLTLLVFAGVVLLVGLSRLYLGVHYPSDVLAGYIIGLAWASFCVLGIEAVRYFRERRPEVAREEEGLEWGTERIRDAMELHPEEMEPPFPRPEG